jgi:hypothetical protein
VFAHGDESEASSESKCKLLFHFHGPTQQALSHHSLIPIWWHDYGVKAELLVYTKVLQVFNSVVVPKAVKLNGPKRATVLTTNGQSAKGLRECGL